MTPKFVDEANSTTSDEISSNDNSTDVEDNDSSSEKKTEDIKIPFNIAKNDIEAKYVLRKGKSLYVRLGKRLPADTGQLLSDLKSVCSLIKDVRRPRQKSARFCSIDFNTEADRDKALKLLKKAELYGKRIFVQKPRTENNEYVKMLMNKKKESQANKYEASKLIKDSLKNKAALPKKTASTNTSLYVKNIPLDTTADDLKAYFPTALKINVRLNVLKNENTAIVNMSSEEKAIEAKKIPVQIGDNKLRIFFAAKKMTAKVELEPKKEKQIFKQRYFNI